MLAGLLLLLAAALPSGRALAAGADAENACFATGPASLSSSDIVTREAAWQCYSQTVSLANDRVFIRWGRDLSAKRHMVARIGHFDRLTLTSFGNSGEIASRTFLARDARPTTSGPQFIVDLPPMKGDITAIVATFDGLSHRATAIDAALVENDPSLAADQMTRQPLIAGLIGMMLVMLLLNLALFRALRESFLVWHSLMVASFASLVAFRTGLINLYIPLDLPSWRALTIIVFGFALASGAMFTRSFVEPECLPRASRKYLGPLALWSAIISIAWAGPFQALRSSGGDWHTMGLLPLLVMTAYTIVQSIRQGSRAARFLAVGCAPLIATFSYQALTQLHPDVVSQDAVMPLILSLAFEALIIVVGVIDRFIALREERDQAVHAARVLEELTEKDPLTGLLNRRAIDTRFDDFLTQGYELVAVLDLDHFKAVNDVSGHSVGDQVLRVCGSVLGSDKDAVAVRMGGEEFLLLLRGEDAEKRAEKLRQSLSLRVAREVEGLEQIVTASMGVLRLPQAAGTIDFSTAYSRADLLLYEAKTAGRNRGVTASLSYFKKEHPGGDQRSSQTAAA